MLNFVPGKIAWAIAFVLTFILWRLSFSLKLGELEVPQLARIFGAILYFAHGCKLALDHLRKGKDNEKTPPVPAAGTDSPRS